MNEPVTSRRRAFGFPLLLIAVGLAALVGNLGLAGFSWLNVLALWPLILVIVGVDLLLAHRMPLAALALDVVVIGVGLLILVTRPFGPTAFPFVNFGNDCPAGAARSSVSVPKGSNARATLHLVGGAGTYTVTGGASDLVDARSDEDDLFLRMSGSDIRITQCDPGRFGGGHGVTVQIANDVPISIDLTGGAGTFDVDLRDAMLSDARFTNGASTTDLKLPKPSGDVPIRMTGGASTLTITLGGAEASVDVTGGLTSFNPPTGSGSGTTLGGRSHWESPGYAAAKDRYTINVTGGASTVTVR